MRMCNRLLRPSDVYYDIGSNTGLFAIDAAVSIPNLTVYAFEPQPRLAGHIRRSIEANKLLNVHCLELLLGAEEATRSFYLTSHSIHASLSPRERRYREISVPMSTIDVLVESGAIRVPDIIKVDVEGAELMVFEGGKRMFKEHMPSVIFEADENMSRMGVETQDLFSSLTRAGCYAFFNIEPSGQLTLPSTPPKCGNYLALSPKHCDRA